MTEKDVDRLLGAYYARRLARGDGLYGNDDELAETCDHAQRDRVDTARADIARADAVRADAVRADARLSAALAAAALVMMLLDAPRRGCRGRRPGRVDAHRDRGHALRRGHRRHRRKLAARELTLALAARRRS